MAYENFTLEQIVTDFDYVIEEGVSLFSDVTEIQLDDFFVNYLQNNIPLAVAIGTEKAKSELIIAPILVEVRRILNNQISLFSGIKFNVDSTRGLVGFCDFIISLSRQQSFVRAPIVTIVEAKNDNLKSGYAQCMAAMIGAKLFNEQKGAAIARIFGAVTNGNQWKFLKLNENTIFIDVEDYYIDRLAKIVSILISCIQSNPQAIAHS